MGKAQYLPKCETTLNWDDPPKNVSAKGIYIYPNLSWPSKNETSASNNILMLIFWFGTSCMILRQPHNLSAKFKGKTLSCIWVKNGIKKEAWTEE